MARLLGARLRPHSFTTSTVPLRFQFYKDGVLIVQTPDLWYIRPHAARSIAGATVRSSMWPRRMIEEKRIYCPRFDRSAACTRSSVVRLIRGRLVAFVTSPNLPAT